MKGDFGSCLFIRDSIGAIYLIPLILKHKILKAFQG